LPLRVFAEDFVTALLSIDSRWYKTVTGLFVKPGKVTFDYIEGRRVCYLSPVRTYLSVSIVYFIVVRLVQSSQVFLIDFSPNEGTTAQVAVIVKYALFFFVPIFGGIVQLFHRKRKAYYVEYLIFALHIHSVWLVLLIVKDLATWLGSTLPTGWIYHITFAVTALAQFAMFMYLVIYLKNTFMQKWVSSISKALGVVALYMLCLVIGTVSYLFIFYE